MTMSFTKLNMSVDNNLIEGTVSQILDLGLSFYFMIKNGKIWVIFSYFIFYIS